MLHYRDPNYYRLRQRTMDWAQHQFVSLLELEGVGRMTLKALHKIGIETATDLLHADAEDVANRLLPYNIPPCQHRTRLRIVREWQQAIAWKLAEREKAATENSSDRIDK